MSDEKNLENEKQTQDPVSTEAAPQTTEDTSIDAIAVEELVEELREYKGRHTEFITVYVPAGYDTNNVQRQLEAEKSTAKNIKSTGTRKNVTEALEKIIRFVHN